MLYLLLPDLTMKWVDVPATSTLKLARENDADLSQLPWEPSERRASTTVVRWALRHGVPTAHGLVLHAPELSVVDTPNEIKKAHEGVKQSREQLANSAASRLVEQIMPGSAEHGRQLDAEVDSSTAAALLEAEKELQESLSAEADHDLIDHWKKLGGALPVPV
ncbi:hypothetical protein [Lentzea sp. HUAS12]|uniref:hypothetical protein n=1 Tax=Lentzea sp. HUAS12 TaxID=2951806 RepID=UPI0020A08043|nr:hypothetical protein [Lentzea sp. HUAS12]USX50616.1 hypothetical protein ND450_35390 [Lentzea sp. HUAS12]